MKDVRQLINVDEALALLDDIEVALSEGQGGNIDTIAIVTRLCPDATVLARATALRADIAQLVSVPDL